MNAGLDVAGPIDWKRTLQEGMLAGLERVGERPCMIAGSFPWLERTPAPRASAPSAPAEAPPRRGRGKPRSVDVILHYRAPWTRDDVSHANVWNVDDDRRSVTILAVVRVNEMAPLVPVAVDVSRARRRERRVVSVIDEDTFAVESTVFDGLPRVRLLLRGAPADVAQKLRDMP